MNRILLTAFLAASLFFLVLALTLDERRMSGDEQGWDPGPRALPVATGGLMLGLTIYLMLRTWNTAPASKQVEPAARRLVLFAIGLSVLYILVFIPLGFVLATTSLLYLLSWFNFKLDLRRDLLAGCLKGWAAGLGFSLVLYTIGRWVSSGLFFYGRSSGQALLADRSFGAGASLLAVSAVFLLAIFIMKRRRGRGLPLGRTSLSVLTAVGLTEGLYIVFQQLFLVELASGLLGW
jgi:hypothetical protein